MKIKHRKGVMSQSQGHKGVTSVIEWLCHSHKHVMDSHMTSNMRTMGSEVHSYDSSCIYSVENQMGTLSSSTYQLRLGVDLSRLS